MLKIIIKSVNFAVIFYAVDNHNWWLFGGFVAGAITTAIILILEQEKD